MEMDCPRREMTFWKASEQKAPFTLVAVRRFSAQSSEMRTALQNSEQNSAKQRPTPYTTPDPWGCSTKLRIS